MGILDEIAKINPIIRMEWPIDKEPVHLPKEDYYKTWKLFINIDPVEIWEESDHSLRNRIKLNTVWINNKV